MKLVVRGLIMLAGMALVLPIYASTMTATCMNFEGPQTDYITNAINPDSDIAFNKFDDHKSKISGEKSILIWEQGNSTAKIMFKGNEANAAEHWHDLILLSNETAHGEQQVTFIGMSRGAPIMYSVYPESNVVIFSQHSHWSFVMEGVRTFMFHSKCDIKFK